MQARTAVLILDYWPSSSFFPKKSAIYLSTLGVVVQFWSRMLPDGLWFLPHPILRLNNGSWVKARNT